MPNETPTLPSDPTDPITEAVLQILQDLSDTCGPTRERYIDLRKKIMERYGLEAGSELAKG